MTVRDKDRTAFKDALDEARAIVDGAKGEDRDLTPDEKAEVDGLIAKAEEVKARIESDSKDDTLALRIAALMGTPTSDEVDDLAPKSLGEAFTDHPLFKAWLAQNAGSDGRVPDSLKNFRTPAVPISGKLLSVATLAGVDDAFPSVDYRGLLVPERLPNGYQLLLTLLSTGTTGADLIHWAEETWTYAAEFVAEADDVADDSGTKPMSDAVYTPKTTAVGTIAHWVAATKWALSDVGQLRALIDSGLRRGITRRIADAVLNGDGSGPGEFVGFLNNAAIADSGTTADLDTIRGALGTVTDNGFSADGIAMNRATWQAISDANPAPLGDPLARRVPNIDGVPAVIIPQMPADTAVVGEFGTAFLLDRETTTITATDSHADFFIRNLVAILGEWRGAFFVPQPKAFVNVGTGA